MVASRKIFKKIIDKSVLIQDEFPELIKYLDEMPTDFSVSISNQISQEDLTKYYDALNALLKNYAKAHSTSTN